MILNTTKLNEIIEDKHKVLKAKPYPHLNPQGLIKDIYFKELRDKDPNVTDKRKGSEGFQSHISFEERKKLNLPEIWSEFLNELENGGEYRDFVSELIKSKEFHFGYEWSYFWKHSLHVHPDSRKKLFTHLFYLLDETNWDESWGGGTSVFKKRLIPKKPSEEVIEKIENFNNPSDHSLNMKKDQLYSYKHVKDPIIMGNYSFFFIQSNKSFHGVLPYDTTPHGRKIRKVFFPIAIMN